MSDSPGSMAVVLWWVARCGKAEMKRKSSTAGASHSPGVYKIGMKGLTRLVSAWVAADCPTTVFLPGLTVHM